MEKMEIHALFVSGSSLTWQDYSVLSVILLLVISVGFFAGREEKSPGGRLVFRSLLLKSAR